MKQSEFVILVKAVFETDSGKQLLEVLKDNYVRITAIRDSNHSTFHALGQKELIQELDNCVNMSIAMLDTQREKENNFDKEIARRELLQQDQFLND